MSGKKPHHPHDPGLWTFPDTENPGFIQGKSALAGFGSRDFCVALIPCRTARSIIQRRHYSGRCVQNSYVHMGIFRRRRLGGVLQFGYALCPARMGKVFAGATNINYLELNRMWLSDVLPRNSESRTLSYAFRFIRRAMPQVRLVQSFADERCGRLGVVYQAANFLYLGSHKSKFWEIDGETFHELIMTAHKKSGGRGVFLRANRHRAIRRSWRQFRYVYPLDRRVIPALRLSIKPYPKPECDITDPTRKPI